MSYRTQVSDSYLEDNFSSNSASIEETSGELSIMDTNQVAAKPALKPLKQNPFVTYRDPVTGRWLVVKSSSSSSSSG